MTLPEDANIYAKEYKLYLPDKKLLQKKRKEWLDEEQNEVSEAKKKQSMEALAKKLDLF